MRHYDIYRYLLSLDMVDLLRERREYKESILKHLTPNYKRMVQSVINYRLRKPINSYDFECIQLSEQYRENEEVTNLIETKHLINKVMVIGSIFTLLLIALNQQFHLFEATGKQGLFVFIGVLVCYLGMHRILKKKALEVANKAKYYMDSERI